MQVLTVRANAESIATRNSRARAISVDPNGTLSTVVTYSTCSSASAKGSSRFGLWVPRTRSGLVRSTTPPSQLSRVADGGRQPDALQRSPAEPLEHRQQHAPGSPTARSKPRVRSGSTAGGGVDAAAGADAEYRRPEGHGDTPNDVAADLCSLLGPEVRKTYKKARCAKSKRGPKITFGEPISGQDPSVDLVVALTRREGDGLWIPNLDMERWEASDPEQHVTLLAGGTESLRRTRRRAVRLTKAWNKQWSDPAFSSFHLSAMALEHVTSGMTIATALHAVFDGGATFLATGCNTPDPAGVSKPLKLMKGVSRDAAVRRLRLAADAMADALEHDDDEGTVQAALHRVFRHYVEAPPEDKLAFAVAALRSGGPVSTVTVGLPGFAVAVPPTRAYGGPRPR